MIKISYPVFDIQNLPQATFSRIGGVSNTPYDSLNVSFHVGDSEKNVLANRERMKQALQVKRLVSGHQIHQDKVFCVREMPDKDYEINGYDAFITDVPGVALMVQQADCQAVLLHDPVKKAVGIAHAGWRGSVANIIGKTIDAMANSYGSKPDDLRAAISPSLGPCCAEFVNYRTELPEEFHHYQVKENYFDFWALSKDQLCVAGVNAQNVFIANICTVCNQDYFSYRRDKVTGRFASIIAIR